MTARDPIVEQFAWVDGEIRDGARAYVDGEQARALEHLEDARIALADLIADLRRALDPEPTA